MSEFKEEKPWLLIEEPDADAIVGNRLGLKYLSEKIDRILANPDEESFTKIADSNISNVILVSKEEYFRKTEPTKESLFQKLIAYFMFVWFIVLPFVAIALFIYMLFFSSENKPEKVFTPACSCMKHEIRPRL